MNEQILPGRVIRFRSGFYSVLTAGGEVTCHLRGRLKRGRATGDLVAIGDEVLVSLQSEGKGSIEEILPRRSILSRAAPTARGTYRQILLANVDQVALVFACAEPAPHLRMLDRFLVILEKQNIPALIIANKTDLIGAEEAQRLFSLYPGLGYPVIYTSALTGEGIGVLRGLITGRFTALAGPSGVGKTSLLNDLQPGLGQEVRQVSQATTRGQHTTILRQVFPLDGGGFIADMPGLRALALWDIQPEELDGYFPELRQLVAECQFNDCTHSHEPGCAVLRAVEQGSVHPARYDSYLRLRFGETD